MNLLAFLKANKLTALLGTGLVVSLAAMPFVWRFAAVDTDVRLKDIAVKAAAIQAENVKLQKENSNISADRENILKQTKTLFAEKAQTDALRQSNEELTQANKAITKQKDALHRNYQSLQRKSDSLEKKHEELKTSHLKLKGDFSASEKETRELRAALAKSVEESPLYQKLAADLKSLKKENDGLKGTIQSLDDKLKKTLERIKKIQDRDLKFAQQASKMKAQVASLSEERSKLIATNAELNVLAMEAPKRFKAMAAENKKLISETAEMHYNLGVFFSQQRNFDRAVKEFNRTLEFNPNYANAHYNLGYLYSEQLDKHELAIRHFSRFLDINPAAQESEVIRSYMLARQTYGDKASPEKQKGELKFR